MRERKDLKNDQVGSLPERILCMTRIEGTISNCWYILPVFVRSLRREDALRFDGF